MFAIGNILQGVAYVLDTVLFLYMWLIIIRAVISWVNPDPYNPIIQFLGRATDPVLDTIRRRVGIIGGIDVSPILAILLIIFLQYAVVETIRDFGMRLKWSSRFNPIGVELRICFMGFSCLKLEIRISKSQTNPKFETQMFQTDSVD